MKRLGLCLAFALCACAVPPDTRIAQDIEPVAEGHAAVEAPVLFETGVLPAPVVLPSCSDQYAATDGIGGTGCP